MKTHSIIACLAIGIIGVTVQAAVIFEEGFEYSNGYLEAVSSWSVTVAENYDVQDYTWSSWGGYESVADKRMGNFAVGTGDNASVSLGTSIDTQTAGTYYISFTVHPDGAAAGWMNVMLKTAAGNFTNTDANNAFVQYNGTSKNFATSDFGTITDTTYAGTDLLIVGRIDFSPTAGSDTGYLSVFSAGESARTLIDNASGANYGFETTNATTISGTLTNFGIRINDDSFIGNIRVGESLLDVGIIPEPASITLLISAVVFLSTGRFRRH